MKTNLRTFGDATKILRSLGIFCFYYRQWAELFWRNLKSKNLASSPKLTSGSFMLRFTVKIVFIKTRTWFCVYI